MRKKPAQQILKIPVRSDVSSGCQLVQLHKMKRSEPKVSHQLSQPEEDDAKRVACLF